MKYIKLFEEIYSNLRKFDKGNNICYKVPTKTPKFWIAQEKIGADANGFFFLDDSAQHDYVLLHRDGIEWTWSPIDAEDFDGDNYIDLPEYMGEVEVTQDEIDDWYMYKNAKKYNL